MNQLLYGFILTFLAGLSTLLGIVVIFIKNSKNIINITLSFTSGVMFAVSITDLIPESINLTNNLLIVTLFLSIGMFISNILDKKINYSNNLYRVGVISMLAIVIHNIPEGIITFISANKDINLGTKLAIAISLHNIPEGISIAVPIYYSTRSFKLCFKYVLIASVSEPIGAIIGYLLLPFINSLILGLIFAIIAGLMIYIACFELLGEVSSKKVKIFYFIIGYLIIYLNHLLFN